MKDNISDLLNELTAEAERCDSRSIQLREAVTTLSALRSERMLGGLRKKRGRPAVIRTFQSTGGGGIMVKDIPVKASKPHFGGKLLNPLPMPKRGRKGKRKYTKRSAFWKKKK